MTDSKDVWPIRVVTCLQRSPGATVAHGSPEPRAASGECGSHVCLESNTQRTPLIRGFHGFSQLFARYPPAERRNRFRDCLGEFFEFFTCEAHTASPRSLPAGMGNLPVNSDFRPRNDEAVNRVADVIGKRPLECVDPVSAYLANLGPGSRRTMSEAVGKLARLVSNGHLDASSLSWHELRHEHTAALRHRLASDLAPATANKHLAALRGVLKQCCRLGQMSIEDYQNAIDVPSVHGPSPRKMRTLSLQEFDRLAAVCEADHSPAGARDAALFALLFGAALRRAEVVSLDFDSLDGDNGSVALIATASRAVRKLALDERARLALKSWLTHRGDAAGPLFNPINKGGRIELRRLSEQAIYIACHKRAAEAGLAPVSPEDLRRSLHASRPSNMRRISHVMTTPAQSA